MDEVLRQAGGEVTRVALDLVLFTVLPYLAVLLRSWIKAKTALIKDQQLREGIEFALTRLDETARTVTAEIRQRFVKRHAAGKVVNAPEAQMKAINYLHGRLDRDTRSTLERLYGKDELARIYRGKVEQHAKVVPRC
jgi:hypothetical protein